MSNVVNVSAAYELQQKNKDLVVGVGRAYREALELPAICATNYDPAPLSVPRRWTTTSCEYVIDVEHGVRDALHNQLDANALQAAWERLQNDSDVIKRVESRFIKLAAPIFAKRQLQPWLYYRSIRRNSSERKLS